MKLRLLVLALLLAGLAQAVVIPSCPYTISSSGTYTLSSDISATGAGCIGVAANDAVIDCGGWTIREYGANATTQAGITLGNAVNRAAIRGCRITDFPIGIYAVGGNYDATIENNIISQAGLPLQYLKRQAVLQNTYNTMVRSNTFTLGLGDHPNQTVCYGVVMTGGRNLTAAGNLFETNVMPPYEAYCTALSLIDSSYNNVTSNVFNRTVEDTTAIYMKNSSWNDVRWNVVDRNHSADGQTMMTSCTVTGSPDVEGGPAPEQGPTYANCIRPAVHITNGSSNNFFANNRVKAWLQLMLSTPTDQNQGSPDECPGSGNNQNNTFWNDTQESPNPGYTVAYSVVLNQSSNAVFKNVTFDFNQVWLGSRSGNPLVGVNNLTVLVHARANVTTIGRAPIAGALVNFSNNTFSINNFTTDAAGLTAWTRLYLVFFGNSTRNTTSQTLYNATAAGFTPVNSAAQYYSSATHAIQMTTAPVGCQNLYYRGPQEGANSLYSLGGDLTTNAATCMVITTPNVTLDCQGHWIEDTGDTWGGTNYGVFVNGPYANATVRNCNILGYARPVGLSPGADFARILNNRLTAQANTTDISAAIHLPGSKNATITNNTLWTVYDRCDYVFQASGPNYTALYVAGGGNHTITNTTFATFWPTPRPACSFDTTDRVYPTGMAAYFENTSGNDVYKADFAGTTTDIPIGIYLNRSNYNLMRRLTLTVSATLRDSQAIVLYNSSYNSVDSGRMTASYITSGESQAVAFLAGSNSNLFSNNIIQSSVIAIFSGSKNGGPGNNRNNTFWNDTVSGSSSDLYSTSTSSTIFKNVTFDMNKIWWTAGGINNLTVYIHARANVTSQAGAAIEGATVVFRNNTHTSATFATNAAGITPWTPLYAMFMGNDTDYVKSDTFYDASHPSYAGNNTSAYYYLSKTHKIILAGAEPPAPAYGPWWKQYSPASGSQFEPNTLVSIWHYWLDTQGLQSFILETTMCNRTAENFSYAANGNWTNATLLLNATEGYYWWRVYATDPDGRKNNTPVYWLWARNIEPPAWGYHSPPDGTRYYAGTYVQLKVFWETYQNLEWFILETNLTTGGALANTTYSAAGAWTNATLFSSLATGNYSWRVYTNNSAGGNVTGWFWIEVIEPPPVPPSSITDGIFIQCPLFSTGTATNATATLYRNGAPACGALLNVTYPNKTTATLAPYECSGGRHAFTIRLYENGIHKLTAYNSTFTDSCLIGGIAYTRSRVPAIDPLLALAAAALALLTARKTAQDRKRPDLPKKATKTQLI